MSAPAAVVVPTTNGEVKPDAAAAATPMKGGMVLSPLPLGGGKRRKTKRLSKKALKALKKMTPKQLKKLMKGGEGEEMMAEGEQTGMGKKKGKGSRKTRRSGLLY